MNLINYNILLAFILMNAKATIDAAAAAGKQFLIAFISMAAVKQIK